MAPLYVLSGLCGFVLLDESLNDFLRAVEFVLAVCLLLLEELGFFEMLRVGVPAVQLLELAVEHVEDVADRGVVCKHHTADFLLRLDVRALLGEGYLQRSRSPWNELSQFALTDSLQGLMHLCWVHIALNDV